MGENSKISWTDNTFNPHMGCQRVSPGCGGARGEGGCYAEALVTGLMGYRPESRDPKRRMKVWGPPATSTRKRTSAENWQDPLKWNTAALCDGVRRRVFCASLGDVFEAHPDLDAVRADLWPLIERCGALDWQLLTKRPENVRRMVPEACLHQWPRHVWMGCTVEDQRRANERIPLLLQVPAKVRFLSCEPLLEAVDLRKLCLPPGPRGRRAQLARTGRWGTCGECPLDAHGSALPERCPHRDRYDHDLDPGISQVIIGGESGPDARAFAVEWARDLLQQCREADVAAFMKQLGDRPTTRLPNSEVWPTHNPTGKKGAQFSGDGYGTYYVRGLAHHGADPSEWPAGLRIQEFPEVRP